MGHRRYRGLVEAPAHYELTDLGHNVVGPLDAILAWSEQHSAEITAAREHYDDRAGQEMVSAS
jgi:DNA-binding HxlR family transcriptional regulator